jgi:hypothetical protein
LINQFQVGKSPKDVVRKQWARTWHFDQHATNLAISVHMSNGRQRDNSNPILRRTGVAPVRFATYQRALDAGTLIGHGGLESINCCIAQASDQEIDTFQRPRRKSPLGIGVAEVVKLPRGRTVVRNGLKAGFGWLAKNHPYRFSFLLVLEPVSERLMALDNAAK